jgi:hypothetical protein
LANWKGSLLLEVDINNDNFFSLLEKAESQMEELRKTLEELKRQVKVKNVPVEE